MRNTHLNPVKASLVDSPEYLGKEINSVFYMIRIIYEKMSRDKVILDQLDRITEVLEA